MKSLYYSLFFCLLTGIFYFLGSGISYGQLKGISLGNSSPHTNSILDISSTEKGVLFPRMTTAERQAIAIDAVVPAGLWVYDTDESAYYFYKKDKWELLGDSTFSKIRAFKQVGTDSLYLYQGKDSIGVQLALPGGGTIQNPDTADLSIRARNEGLVAGNARGIHSVDLQTKRDNVNQVARGNFSALLGGALNKTSLLPIGNVNGGYANTTSQQYSNVNGGCFNTASGLHSNVNGGYMDIASGHYSVVSGGQVNITRGDYSTVGGGRNNIASGDYSAVSGGRRNIAYSYGEWVGGLYATTYTPKSTISFNDSDRLFVVGNGTNTSTRSNALTLLKNAHLGIGISAPQQRLDLGGSAQDGLLRLGNVITTPTNSASAKGSIAYNYTTNSLQYHDGIVWKEIERKSGTMQSPNIVNLSIRASNEGGSVAGNARGIHSVDLQTSRENAEQIAGASSSILVGGRNNTIPAVVNVYGAIVSGGGQNTASGRVNAIVSGGGQNTASGRANAIVSGGGQNTASGVYALVSGGRGNSANSYGQWVGGLYNIIEDGDKNVYDPSDKLFVVGNGKDSSDRSNAMMIFKDGPVVFEGGWTHNSDRRLKKDIERLDGSLAKIGLLTPQKYNWTDTSRYRRGKSVGFIAQEVEQVLPHLVATQKGTTMRLNGVQIDGVKTLNYIGFVPYLIRATQELNVQLQADQKSNNELQTELEVEKKNIQNMALEIEKMKSILQDMAALKTVDKL